MSNLKTLWIVLCKELKDLSRDRRTIIISLLLMPLAFPVIMAVIFNMTENRIRSLSEKTLELPVIGRENAPNLIAWLESQNVTIQTPPKDIAAAIADQKTDVVLRIPSNFGEQWHQSKPAQIEILSDSTRQNASISVNRLRTLLAAYGNQVGMLRQLARGVNPSIATPLQIKDTDMATEAAKRSQLTSILLPYLLILSAFIGGAHLIIDTTAGERERQSLEPLLATPASRQAIVSGKVAASCVISLISITLTLLAFKAASLIAPVIGRQMSVSYTSIALLLLVLLPIIFIGTTLLTYISASAKSIKEAQSHISYLMLLPMLPSMILMVNPIKTQLWQFAVPFLSQNQMVLKVVRGEDISAAQWCIYLVTSCSIAIVMWMLAVRRYRGEQLAISG